ncbi:riboflavin kinase [Tulasnella sp. 419]|nr:riboflavin kinase [Tulasnella sp. 419]
MTTTAKSPERRPAPLQTESFRLSRPSIVGPEVPEPPFPITLCGTVQRGFGRGGKDLGCPTANLSDDALESLTTSVETGIYYGYARLHAPTAGNADSDQSSHDETRKQDELETWPMVMSLGWNPFYKNEKLTAEIHIMHNFETDFYGHKLSAVILGYIRPELDYTSREALIQDIETDKKVALNSLERPAYKSFANACPLTL